MQYHRDGTINYTYLNPDSSPQARKDFLNCAIFRLLQSDGCWYVKKGLLAMQSLPSYMLTGRGKTTALLFMIILETGLNVLKRKGRGRYRPEGGPGRAGPVSSQIIEGFRET